MLMHAKTSQQQQQQQLPQLRQFSHIRLLLLLVVVLDFNVLEPTSSVYQHYYEQDLVYCRDCFEQQSAACERLHATALVPAAPLGIGAVLASLPRLFGGARRASDVLQQRDAATATTPLIAKYFGPPGADEPPSHAVVLRRFSDPERLEGFQFCPAAALPRFMAQLGGAGNLTVALYLLHNVQLLLLPVLFARGFPVPATHAVCGFTLYSAYGGRSLVYYYDAPFPLRTRIAVQLLQAALRFTEGFDDFRIYLTDLTADNIVYDAAHTGQLSIVDLDSVLVVDSRAATVAATHRHMPIDCDACFAYVPQDICAHQRSDLNLYAACQFLREDLRRDRAKGFLQPIPEEIQAAYPALGQLLDRCVDCDAARCSDRFAATHELIKVLELILLHLQAK